MKICKILIFTLSLVFLANAGAAFAAEGAHLLRLPSHSQWDAIQRIFSTKPIRNSKDLHQAVNESLSVLGEKSTAIANPEKVSLDFNNSADEQEFYSKILPFIIEQALSLQAIPADHFPILRQGESKKIRITDEIALKLVAAMFLSLIPEASASDFSGFKFYPILFPKVHFDHFDEKIRAFVSYFRQRAVDNNRRPRIIEIARHQFNGDIARIFASNPNVLSEIDFAADQKIENVEESAHVDFANRLIGGGVLSQGLAQEEILFTIYPEKIVAKLFCPALLDSESVTIEGARRYTNYEGYSFSFKSKGPFVVEDDSEKHVDTDICIDATMFPDPSDLAGQLKFLDRDLRKATSGFRGALKYSKIATGPWGCGFFGGNKKLKFVIQWLASSYSGKTLIYTIDDHQLKTELEGFYSKLTLNQVSVGELYRAVKNLDNSQLTDQGFFPMLSDELGI